MNARIEKKQDRTEMYSYSSLILIVFNDTRKKMRVTKHFDYSNTTAKHINKLTGLSVPELRWLIKHKCVDYVDLDGKTELKYIS